MEDQIVGKSESERVVLELVDCALVSTSVSGNFEEIID